MGERLQMKELFSEELKSRIRSSGVIAVLVIENIEDAVPVARALLEGGVSAMELTLRTPAALEALKRIRSDAPQLLAGIGTILRADQIKAVASAGAELGVAPGYNPRVVDAAKSVGLPFAPGVATATELEWALDQGCRILKFFPAEPLGGISYLKSMNGPYGYLDLQYIPLGGVNQDNLRAWLQQSFVIAVGGSWIADKKLIAARNWDEISRRAERAYSIFKEVRG
jgi:2-dehydro-3-deoxyphosphogluconate aldolase/(4S)-4-hydroxy-2-oxoglutarate aldolase